MTEPEIFRRAKAFHRYVMNDWLQSAEGVIIPERLELISDHGRQRVGKIDIFVDTSDGLLVVVEIKSSDWDSMSQSSIERNVVRYSRRLWTHIEKSLDEEQEQVQGVMICPRGKNRKRRKLVEQLFEERGITVSWVPWPT